jgi:hypothetical protein
MVHRRATLLRANRADTLHRANRVVTLHRASRVVILHKASREVIRHSKVATVNHLPDIRDSRATARSRSKEDILHSKAAILRSNHRKANRRTRHSRAREDTTDHHRQASQDTRHRADNRVMEASKVVMAVHHRNHHGTRNSVVVWSRRDVN